MIDDDKEVVLVNDVEDFVDFVFEGGLEKVQVKERTAGDCGADLVLFNVLLCAVFEAPLDFELRLKGFGLFGLVPEFVVVLVLPDHNFLVLLVDFYRVCPEIGMLWVFLSFEFVQKIKEKVQLGNLILFVVLVHVVPDARPDFLYMQLNPTPQLTNATLRQKRIFQLLRKVNVPDHYFHVTDLLKRLRNTVFHQSLNRSVKVLQELNAVHRVGVHLLLKVNVIMADFQFLQLTGTLLADDLVNVFVQTLHVSEDLFAGVP
jgi:hypothetical protein